MRRNLLARAVHHPKLLPRSGNKVAFHQLAPHLLPLRWRSATAGDLTVWSGIPHFHDLLRLSLIDLH